MAESTELADSVTKSLTGRRPRSLDVADKGIKTGSDFAAMMSALMSDLIDGRVEPGVANATCNAGGKLLRVVELQYRYGTTADPNGEKVLRLTK